MIPADSTLEEALDYCLSGGISPNDCLRQFPQHAADLRPLLDVARQLEPRRSLPPPAARSRLDRRIMAALRRNPATGVTVQPAHRPTVRWQGAALVLALLLFISTLTNTAAQSLPGELLYPLKRGSEGVRVSLTSGDFPRASLHLELATTRLDEIEQLGLRRIPIASDLLFDLDSNISVVVNLLRASTESRVASVAPRLLNVCEREQRTLAVMREGLLPEVRSAYQQVSQQLVNHVAIARTAVRGSQPTASATIIVPPTAALSSTIMPSPTMPVTITPLAPPMTVTGTPIATSVPGPAVPGPEQPAPTVPPSATAGQFASPTAVVAPPTAAPTAEPPAATRPPRVHPTAPAKTTPPPARPSPTEPERQPAPSPARPTPTEPLPPTRPLVIDPTVPPVAPTKPPVIEPTVPSVPPGIKPPPTTDSANPPHEDKNKGKDKNKDKGKDK